MLSTKMKICQVMCIRQLHQLPGTPPFSHSFINVNVNVNVEFKVKFTNKSVTGASYSIKSYSLSHSWTLW